MSATLDAEKFSQYFNNAKIFHVRGRQFPVRLLATIEPQKDYIDSALTTILQIHLEHPKGDVLVFLTGQEDIESVQTLLESYSTQLPQDTDKLIICPLFAKYFQLILRLKFCLACQLLSRQIYLPKHQTDAEK